ncbi:amino acid ABC transporter permease [Truepera radiovictrix]|uniref:Polar amino acid ABC transporter, inner membrane subunit n=1 Tax=Truepera radiovictrix (strain DSM 17093 / CIP 108686 / LMG 22925 / RQ-24) TaxID=649638 RepID=D7CQZ3_TRURR|nr:amino acid ABC transporter permease [Truepera radiovictrix]ADI15127.1 polar amino acid ABC transporter, inner membrane subunit [Truepera radiovictrix DSM 17093]WMT56320.1 amino acid ABC transporter permease [Truepera radiovictrix]
MVARPPPTVQTGAGAWLRKNLFSSLPNAITTVLVAALLAWLLYGLLSWVFLGASWQQVWNNLRLFAVFRYPAELLWRPLAAVGVGMLLLGLSAGAATDGVGRIFRGVFWQFAALVFFLTLVALLFWESVRWPYVGVSVATVLGFALGSALQGSAPLKRALPWLWAAAFVGAFFLLYGLPGVRSGPWRVVPTREWGGMMLTFVLSFVGIGVSFPIGVALALGRRSKLPAIKLFCIAYIEIIRGAPLISWLFIASLMVPLIFNVGPERVSALTRALVALTLFSAAYMAENVRGGLQAVPKGQSEAARALGLSGWQAMRLIILPQALKAVIPAIVGQAIGLFKDTSLVLIVGLADFFQVHNIVAQQNASLQVVGGIRLELSLFLAVVYWFFAYRMSVASRQLEKELGVGTR